MRLHLRPYCEVDRPKFPRHLRAMENGQFGGIYEHEGVLPRFRGQLS
jgi:hypothetical protein